MRAISDSQVRTFANQASVSMVRDNIALVLNNAFGPVSRSDLFPYTLFDAFKNVSFVINATEPQKTALNVKLRATQSLILLCCGHTQQMNHGQ